MKISNRLRISFGIMLVAVLCVSAAASVVMLSAVATMATTLHRSAEAVAALESVGDRAREYNVIATAMVGSTGLRKLYAGRLDAHEAQVKDSLAKLSTLDPLSGRLGAATIAQDVEHTRRVLAEAAEIQDAAAATHPAPLPATAAPPTGARNRGPRRAAPEPQDAPQPPEVEGESVVDTQTHQRSALVALQEQVIRELATIRDMQYTANEKVLKQTSLHVQRFLAFPLALALAAGAAIAWLFAGVRRNVLRPLQTLATGARRASAERDLTLSMQPSGDAEVQDLGRALSLLMETLRGITLDLSGTTDRLFTSAEELGGVTQAQGTSISRQASSLEEARRTSRALRELSRSAATQAEGVLRVAERAEALGRDGEAAMTESLSAEDVIQGQTRRVVERISRLATSAQQIGTITATVKDLADQSDVLALNAAIQAARAGEAGAGFAVVAREMRSLAERSILATVEVRTVLAEVLAGIHESAALVEAATVGLGEGTARTRRLGESVAGLSGIVRENLSAVREIAGAVASQGSGITQLSSAVEDLSEMMEETVRNVSTTGAAAAVLREVSEQLSSKMRQFRV